MYESMTPVASACGTSAAWIGHRLRADQLGDLRRRGAVGAPLEALHVGDASRAASSCRCPAAATAPCRAASFPAWRACRRAPCATPCRASSSRAYDVARNGMPSRPYSGSSFSKLTSRISPACAWPPCTARLISGALNSDAFGWTWILSLPPRRLVDVVGELLDVLGVEVRRRGTRWAGPTWSARRRAARARSRAAAAKATRRFIGGLLEAAGCAGSASSRDSMLSDRRRASAPGRDCSAA